MRKITLFLFMSILSVSMVMADSKQTVTVNGSAVGKSATRLTFSGDNITLTYTDGTSQSADMSNVNLAFDYVANFKSTDFDNSVTIKTFGGKTMTAEVTMTLRSGQWQAICLPFDMNASLISTVFGNNTQVAALESATNAGIIHGFEEQPIPSGTITFENCQFETDTPLEIKNADISLKGLEYTRNIQK